MLRKNYNKHVVITGSEGLIGKSICNILEKKKIKYLKIDKSLGYDIKSLKTFNFLKKINIKTFIHCAAHPGGLSNSNPIENSKVNMTGSLKLINLAIAKKAKVIFTSSSSVYGEINSSSIDEGTKLDPKTIYAVNKIAIENCIKILGKINKSPWTILRLFPTYGAFHRPNTYQGIVNIMLTQILNSKTIIVKGSLSRKRDLIYAKDAADAIYETIYNTKSNNEIINVCSGIKTTIREIITTIIDILGFNINNYDIIIKKQLMGDSNCLIGNPKKIKKILNFKQKFKFQKGIEDMLKNY